MRTKVVLVLWLALAAAVFNGFLDLYVSRGAREYLEKQAEFELGRAPEPAMAVVMSRAAHDGVVAGSLWSILIVGAGWVTVGVRRRA